MNSDRSDCQYDVCLSFAGEDREYVSAVAEELHDRNIPVFYDKYEDVQLWGEDLQERFVTVYQYSARYCVMFVSRHYRDKVWPHHEAASALARALRDREYLLPVRFDDTALPGLLPTIGYVDANAKTPEQLANMIEEKISRSRRDNYFPPNPICLLSALGTSDEDDEKTVILASHRFFDSLKLMTPEERRVVFLFFLYACPGDLPDNIHIYQDLLSRHTDVAVRDLRRVLGTISSLGFVTKERAGHEDDDDLGDKTMFELEWHDRSVDGAGNATGIAHETVDLVLQRRCAKCGMDALMRLDFSEVGMVEAAGTGDVDETGAILGVPIEGRDSQKGVATARGHPGCRLSDE